MTAWREDKKIEKVFDHLHTFALSLSQKLKAYADGHKISLFMTGTGYQ